jgi:hypothetical protein
MTDFVKVIEDEFTTLLNDIEAEVRKLFAHSDNTVQATASTIVAKVQVAHQNIAVAKADASDAAANAAEDAKPQVPGGQPTVVEDNLVTANIGANSQAPSTP